MAARITDLKVAAAGAASSVEAAKKRLAAAESEGAANAALTRDLEEQKAETDAFLQDAVERLTRLENIKGGLTLKVESRRGALAQADENEQKLLRAIEAARGGKAQAGRRPVRDRGPVRLCVRHRRKRHRGRAHDLFLLYHVSGVEPHFPQGKAVEGAVRRYCGGCRGHRDPGHGMTKL